MMTKKTRALVAAGAGAAVLLASGATFALWTASDSIEGSTITAGTLGIDVGNFEWRYTATDGNTAPGTVINPATFVLVPGDTLHGKVSTPLSTWFSGDNMAVRLDVVVGNNDPVSFYANPGAGIGFDLSKLDQIDWHAYNNSIPGLVVEPKAVPVVTGNLITGVDLSVDLTWEGATGTEGSGEKVTIADAKFTLTQIRPGQMPTQE